MRKIDQAAFFYDVIFKMAAISHNLKIKFIYKYKVHVWPIFYTIFRVKNYDYVINIEIKGHQMSLNIISRS